MDACKESINSTRRILDAGAAQPGARQLANHSRVLGRHSIVNILSLSILLLSKSMCQENHRRHFVSFENVTTCISALLSVDTTPQRPMEADEVELLPFCAASLVSSRSYSDWRLTFTSRGRVPALEDLNMSHFEQ